jgi:hypothetical protein
MNTDWIKHLQIIPLPKTGFCINRSSSTQFVEIPVVPKSVEALLPQFSLFECD